MGFINREQMDRRLADQHNLVERMKVPASSKENPSTDPRPPFDEGKFKTTGETREKQVYSNGLRAVIAAAAQMSSPKEAADAFGVAPSYANALANGDYSRNIDLLKREDANSKLREEIYAALGEIRETARIKLLQVLGLINETSLQAIPDKDKARIAATMANQLSGVIDKTIEKGRDVNDNRSAHLHLYSPEQREVGQYQMVKVNAKVPEANTEKEQNYDSNSFSNDNVIDATTVESSAANGNG